MSTTMEAYPVSDTGTTQDTTRVTFREIRERTFRALRTAGSSSAEARTATEQVLFAELHGGTGLTELIDGLSAGPRGRVRLTRATEGPAETWAADCTGGGHVSALRHGTALIELVAGEPRITLVVRSGLSASSALLDEPLSRSAATTGHCLSVWERTAHRSRIRTAAPDGSVASGLVDPEDGIAATLAALPLGAVVIQASELPVAGELAWRGIDEQRARRHRAATEGIFVQTSAWQHLGAIAQNFLVPEL